MGGVFDAAKGVGLAALAGGPMAGGIAGGIGGAKALGLGNPFNKSTTTVDPFTGVDRAGVIDPLSQQIQQLGSTFDYSKVQDAFKSPMSGQVLEGNAASILQGLNPESFMQASQGFLGGAQGQFANAAGKVGSDPLGAMNFFQRALDPNFADPTKNAQVQGVLDSIVNQGQRGFNIGADKVAGAANAASGGVGQGSAKTDALSRLSADISAQVADQSANVLLGEGQRLQGVQQSAAQQALGEGNRQAEILAMLGGQMGGLGAQFGNLGLDATKTQASGLADLGQRFASRDLEGAMFPLMQQLGLAQLLKSGQYVQNPSLYDNISRVAGDVGGLAKAFGMTKGA